MAAATTIKEVKTQSGKTKYQAQVWHKGVFYASKTFDLLSLARAYKEEALKLVVQGKLQPASVRASARAANADLDRPMSHWAELYAQPVAGKVRGSDIVAGPRPRHSSSRLSDYLLVGRLLADRTLRDFDGKAGAQLIEQLAHDWRHDRRPRSKQPRLADAPPPRPLKENTVRLRLTALLRLIRFAKSKLPTAASFELPAIDELFEFKLPPAHGEPRKREPTDAELAQLLRHFGADSEYSHFLRVIDETGCRLSEVRSATGSDVHFFVVAGQVVGGYLTLSKHKTSAKKGTREVPLSLFAAQLLHERKQRVGDGRLFGGIGSKDRVCKDFDEACRVLSIDDLQIKDSRRAFINRNKYCVAHVDMVHIVGESSLLDSASITDSERNVRDAVGHASIHTTSGYSRPRLEELAHVFTRTSRWARVAALLQPPARQPERATDDVAALQKVLADTLARLARAGVTAEAA
jgi:integrase